MDNGISSSPFALETTSETMMDAAKTGRRNFITLLVSETTGVLKRKYISTENKINNNIVILNGLVLSTYHISG